MKISVCIPQYNRCEYLIRNLETIARQTHRDLEVVVSDDASTDDTEEHVRRIAGDYPFPLIYHRHATNVGFDANTRKSMELATGEYCFVLGNDDTLNGEDAISNLARILRLEGRPELGFCNYVEDHDRSFVHERAPFTGVVGSGPAVALRHYRSFSYVAGIFFRRSSFDRVNADRHDGSVYVQMYLATRIMAQGGRLLLVKEPLVVKDIHVGGTMADSYRERLARSWREFTPLTIGFPSVARVVVAGLTEAGVGRRRALRRVWTDLFRTTYPYWLLDYRRNGSYVSAVGVAVGLNPLRADFLRGLGRPARLALCLQYLASTAVGLLTPVRLFEWLGPRIHRYLKGAGNSRSADLGNGEARLAHADLLTLATVADDQGVSRNRTRLFDEVPYPSLDRV